MCGTTYDLYLTVDYGPITSQYMQILNHSFYVADVQGNGVWGGHAKLNNYDGGFSKFDWSVWGLKLTPGRTYTINWNENVPYGPQSLIFVEQYTFPGEYTEFSPCVAHDTALFDIEGTQSFYTENSCSNIDSTYGDFLISVTDDLTLIHQSTSNLGDRVSYYSINDELVEIIEAPINAEVNAREVTNELRLDYGNDIRIFSTNNIEGTSIWIIEKNIGNHFVYFVSSMQVDDLIAISSNFEYK